MRGWCLAQLSAAPLPRGDGASGLAQAAGKCGASLLGEACRTKRLSDALLG